MLRLFIHLLGDYRLSVKRNGGVFIKYLCQANSLLQVKLNPIYFLIGLFRDTRSTEIFKPDRFQVAELGLCKIMERLQDRPLSYENKTRDAEQAKVAVTVNDAAPKVAIESQNIWNNTRFVLSINARVVECFYKLLGTKEDTHRRMQLSFASVHFHGYFALNTYELGEFLQMTFISCRQLKGDLSFLRNVSIGKEKTGPVSRILALIIRNTRTINHYLSSKLVKMNVRFMEMSINC